MKSFIIIVVIILLVAVGAWLWLSTNAPALNNYQLSNNTTTSVATSTNTQSAHKEQEQTYRSDQYRFSFVAPRPYQIHAYTSNIIAIGNATTNGFDAVAQVDLAQSGNEGGYQDFDAFLFESTKNMCAADGPNESIYCDQMQQKQSYTTTNGLQGIMFYQRRVDKDLASGSTTTDLFGPIYAFNIQANTPDSRFSALIVHPPANLSETEVQKNVVQVVADTVQINKVE